MKCKKIAFFLLAALLLLVSCKKDEPEDVVEVTPMPVVEDETPPPLETFTFTRDNFPRMTGSPATEPLAEALAAVMLGKSRENVRKLGFSRTTQAFRYLADGSCEILIAGEPAPSVLDEISKQDFRYDIAPIATDALVFIVSKSNPVDNLTSEQVRSIYKGEITGWQQVGGNDLDIAAFQRNEEASSQILMEKLVMDWDKMADAPMQTISPGFAMFDDDSLPTAIKGFDGSVNAIGYTMYYYAANMEMASGYKILSIDGVMPTRDTISSGAYPFLSPYYAVISKELPEDDGARILYNWLLSDEGQGFIASQGYVPINSSPVLSDVPPVPAPEMRWAVATEDSKLTPYSSLRSRSSRLRDAALPALEPFDGYGLLLPYSTAVTMNDGSIHAAKYGFVSAQSGTVVTDPIYDNVTRAVFASETGDVSGLTTDPTLTALNAYRLELNLPDGDPDYGFQTIQAVCASDGSWITPFSYLNVVFRESIIFCLYADETFDIDVYDYNGNLLYNILDLDWADRISEDAWSWQLMYSESDGYGFVLLDDDTFAVMNMLTGDITETDFADAYMFSDGLASVVPGGGNGLWGFVDKDLELVIPATYVREGSFINGRAIVETPDGAQHVIDKQGNVLFSVSEDEMLTPSLGGFGYCVFSKKVYRQLPVLLDDSFNEIEYPAAQQGPESSLTLLQNGWFFYMTENGMWLFNADTTIPLPSSVQDVADFANYQHGFIVFIEFDSEGGVSSTGVMASDGSVLLEPQDNSSVTLAADGDGSVYFMLNTISSYGSWDYSVGEDYTQAIFDLFGQSSQATEVTTLKTDLGIISYDEASGYFYVQGTDYFAWLDKNGETLISIPSMGYTYD